MENDLEEKIKELEARIIVLERAERNRKAKNLFGILIRIAIIIVIGVILYKAYLYVDKTYIRPVKEIKEKVDNFSSGLSDSKISEWLKPNNDGSENNSNSSLDESKIKDWFNDFLH